MGERGNIYTKMACLGVLYRKKDLSKMEWRYMLEDQRLLWRFKRGSADALRGIYEKYKNDLLKLAMTLLNDVHVAEDVVQDVFVQLAGAAERIQLHGNLKSYLATCLVNRIRNLKRDRGRHETVGIDQAEAIAVASSGPDQWLIVSEELRLLSEALAQIPYEQREVITLHMQPGLTFSQIAKLQATSINTVQGRYRYGMDKLRSILNGKVENET